jgi:multidrug efflux pump subunit AcrA (membrane-fusion protein)
VVFVPKSEAKEKPDEHPKAPDTDHKDGDHRKSSSPGKQEEGIAFEVREVEVGPEANGTVRILGGLKAGERVVVKGAFTLKTQLIKGELGHDD